MPELITWINDYSLSRLIAINEKDREVIEDQRSELKDLKRFHIYIYIL